MARRQNAATARTVDPAERILDACLAEAARGGWAGLRLNRVADALGLPLVEVYRHYRDADAVAEAWLSRADRAMLAAASAPGFARRTPRDRLERTLFAWLSALAPHRKVARDVLLGKLYPGHPHHLLALVFRLSRTVQWWREAARLDAPPPQRQAEEIGLTAIFAATLACWAADPSPDQAATRALLGRALDAGGAVMARAGNLRQRSGERRAA